MVKPKLSAFEKKHGMTVEEALQRYKDGDYTMKFDRDGNALGIWDGFNKSTFIRMGELD